MNENEERLQLLIDACKGLQNDRLRSFIDQGGIGKVMETLAKHEQPGEPAECNCFRRADLGERHLPDCPAAKPAPQPQPERVPSAPGWYASTAREILFYMRDKNPPYVPTDVWLGKVADIIAKRAAAAERDLRAENARLREAATFTIQELEHACKVLDGEDGGDLATDFAICIARLVAALQPADTPTH